MSDIVERLREPVTASQFVSVGHIYRHVETQRAEAADAIERLEADMEKCKLEVEAYWQAKEKAEADLAAANAEREELKGAILRSLPSGMSEYILSATDAELAASKEGA